MSKRLLTLIGGFALAAMLLGGCATNNNQNPPPEDVKNGVVDDNNLNNDNNIGNDINDQITNDTYPESEDINTDHDKDPAKDNNTPQEDVIEDDIDVRDNDNKDE
jgi:hypothetical protein